RHYLRPQEERRTRIPHHPRRIPAVDLGRRHPDRPRTRNGGGTQRSASSLLPATTLMPLSLSYEIQHANHGYLTLRQRSSRRARPHDKRRSNGRSVTSSAVSYSSVSQQR